MVEGGVCIGVWECLEMHAWLSVVCVDVLYRGGRCGFKCLARLGVVELNVVCSYWCVKVCCVDIHWECGLCL